MKYRMPDYYKDFKCIADKCPDTCCSGWDIVIDDKSMRKYEELEADLKNYVMDGINEKEQVFKRCGARCAFLDENNLCNLYKKAGKESLCKTCSRYPRHFEEYGELVEAALSMSCPVAARMIIDRKAKDRFLVKENDKKSPHAKEVDKKLLDVLLKVRKTAFEIVSDRDLHMEERIRKLMCFGGEIQPVLYEFERLGIKRHLRLYSERVLGKLEETYIKKNNVNKTLKSIDRVSVRKIKKDFFEVLSGLEKINDNWEEQVNHIVNTLYVDLSDEEYLELSKEFSLYMQDRQYEYEHILNYFLYTYFLGGVYDYNVHGMIKMSVISTIVIREMGMAVWLENDKEFSVDDQIKVAYTYSRQIEHSDNNLMCMEGLMTAHPVFEDEKILVAIEKLY